MEEKENTSNSVKTIFTIIIIAATVLIGAFFLIKNLLCRRSYTKIIASNFVVYDLTRAVMGNDAEITMLVEPGKNFHDFEASSGDLEAIKNSDLFIYIGGESESWAGRVINDENRYEQKYLNLSGFVGLMADNSGSNEEDMRSGYYQYGTDRSFDEHVWMSLTNVITMVHVISDRLAMIYPDNREVYFKNAEEYARRINDIDQQFRHPYYEFGPKTVAVADMFPFAYMLKEYNINFVSATDGCNKQTKLGDTSKFIAEAKRKNAAAVFKTELSSNNDFAAKTAAELGVPVYEINTVHSISKEDFEKGVTFIDIAQKNLENFLKLYK